MQLNWLQELKAEVLPVKRGQVPSAAALSCHDRALNAGDIMSVARVSYQGLSRGRELRMRVPELTRWGRASPLANPSR